MLVSSIQLTSSTQGRGGFSICKTAERYCYAYPLRRDQDPSPRLHCCFLTAPPLSPHPFPSLISNRLNLPFGTQGRSWRLNETYFLQTRTGETEGLLYPGTPQGPASFQKYSTPSLTDSSRAYVIWPQPTFLTLNPISIICCRHTMLSQPQNLHMLLPFVCPSL